MEHKPTLKRQLIRFFFSGIGAVIIDFAVYFALLEIMDIIPAKAIGFISGTVFAYLLNKYWTFEDRKFLLSQPLKFGVLYTLTFFANGWVNYEVMKGYNQALIAFLVATAVSTVLNFIGQKFWVFKK